MTRRALAARHARAGRPTSLGWHVACGVMALGAVGLVVTVLLDAPLISILLAGLLLLCPLLLWAPFRDESHSLAALRPRETRR